MFPTSEGLKLSARKLHLPEKKLLLAGGGLLAACLLLVVLLALNIFGTSSAKIPADVTQKIQFPIYLPTRLPDNYTIDSNSFTLVESDTVLIFSAKDGSGNSLVFSEQAKPQNVNFDAFHKGNFEDPKTLSGVPYATVWGKSIDGRLALSTVTKDTWIIMATSTSLGESDMQHIAQGMKAR